jgi:hypothetical protein
MGGHDGGALGLTFTASTRQTPMSEVGVEAGGREGWCGAPGGDADGTYPRPHAPEAVSRAPASSSTDPSCK